MPNPKGPKTKKIIQKRVARRERFARMARIRHRKGKATQIATATDLELIPKYEPQNEVYENVLGLMVSASDEGLNSEISLLNNSYVSNSVTVQNETNKLISVKLHKNDHKRNELKDQVLDEWEKKEDPYWIEWAKHFKYVKKGYKEFLDKYKDKFGETKLDEESIKRQKDHAAKRDELMATKACMEVRTRFNDKGSAASEILFNSSFVSKLNYDFEEFIQRILVEGLPRLHPPNIRNLKKPTLTYSLEEVFNQSVDAPLPDSVFLSKNSSIKQVDCNITLGGYFIKNAGEISFILSLNDSSALLEEENINRPIYRLYMEQQMTHEAERKYFLETFYKDHMAEIMIKPKETCMIKECSDTVGEEPEETDKNSIGSSRMSEELVIKDTVDFYNRSANKETNVSVPYTDYLTQFMPQMQLMKRIYQSQQKMLNDLLKQNSNQTLTKHE